MTTWVVSACITIAAGTLAFGAVYPWAYWPLLAGCLALGVTALTLSWRSNRHPVVPAAVAVGLALIGLVVGLQLIPLRPSTLSAISPATDRFLAQFDVAYATAINSGNPDVRHTLSVAPAETLLGAALFAGLAVYLLGAATILDRTRARRFARGLVVIGVLLAVIGIVQKASASTLVYGFWKPIGSGDPFGPFVNRNHFAGWMVMVLSLAVGHFSGRLATAMKGVKAGWRHRVLWWSTPEASELVLTGFALVIMGIALVLSMSRSGITCWAIALVIAAWFGARRQVSASRGRFAAGYLVAVGAVALAWVGVDRLIARFAAASWPTLGGRLGAWSDALGVARDFPIAGTGLNTYGAAMLFYQHHDLSVHYAEAHNEYLQLMAEGGVLLSMCVLIAVATFAVTVRGRFRAAGQASESYWLRLGAVTGMVAIALQSIVEFSLQMPANAMLFATLAALALHDGRVVNVHRA